MVISLNNRCLKCTRNRCCILLGEFSLCFDHLTAYLHALEWCFLTEPTSPGRRMLNNAIIRQIPANLMNFHGRKFWEKVLQQNSHKFAGFVEWKQREAFKEEYPGSKFDEEGDAYLERVTSRMPTVFYPDRDPLMDIAISCLKDEVETVGGIDSFRISTRNIPNQP